MNFNVLIVDDSELERKYIISVIRQIENADKLIEANNGLEGLKILAKERIDLILCDIVMPQMDGYKFIMTLNEHENLKDIPVILLSSLSDINGKVKGLEVGAWDYITKPYNPLELVARVKVMLRIKFLQDKLKLKMKELEKLSIIDTLTGLYNKKYLLEYLKREIKRSDRYGNLLTCIMMDVDKFKEINDTFGHQKGDVILKELGYILSEMLRGYDFASRFGGDEFAIILLQNNSYASEAVAERIRKMIENYKFAKKEGESIGGIYITVSLGSTTYPSKGIETYEDIISAADSALYKAKANGRNRVEISGNVNE